MQTNASQLSTVLFVWVQEHNGTASMSISWNMLCSWKGGCVQYDEICMVKCNFICTGNMTQISASKYNMHKNR